MTCKDIEKLIQSFLDDDLDNKDLSEFISHIESCSECKEELTIQFLVKVGMKRLEDGNTFNLRDELELLMRDSKKSLKARRYLVFTSYVLELAVIVLGVITVVLSFIL